MANKEHLAILQEALEKQDINIWNKWRNTYFQNQTQRMKVDARNRSWEDIDLSYTKLNRVKLRGANLGGINFTGANLSYTDLSDVILNRTTLVSANLSGSIIDKSIVQYVNFTNCDFRSAILSDIDFKKTTLAHANLQSTKLVRVNLSDVNLSNADIRKVDLRSVNLRQAKLREADLSGAILTDVDITGANLLDTDLTGANLRQSILNKTNLSGAILIDTDLTDANLTEANLSGANLTNSILNNADLNGVSCNRTIFANVDLSESKNLDNAQHSGPSSIGIDTLKKSKGRIPEKFLRGCGVSDRIIVFARSLLETPIDYYSCFISYSTADEDFAILLYNTLQAAGIRCWYAPEQLLPGQRIDEGINRGIQYWDKVVFCASKSSLTEKWWVDFEVDKAFDKEMDLQRRNKEHVGILIPLNLDGYMFSDDYRSHPRASQFKTTLAADFVGWRNDLTKFNWEVQRLIKSLRTDGGLEEPPPNKINPKKNSNSEF